MDDAYSSSAADDEPAVAGAGVVPVAVHDGVVYALLGRERYVRGWSSSLKWSGFEGGSNPHESPIRNAVRECVEESLGTFTDFESLFADLVNENYIAKVTVRTPSSGKLHITYFKLIEFDSSINVRFAKSLAYLHELQHLGGKLRGDRRGRRRSESLSEGAAASAEESTSGVDGGWTTVRSHEQVNMAKTRNAIENLLDNNVHSARFQKIKDLAIRVERDKQGDITRLTVKEEFLEKTQVRFWPLSELRAAIANGGNGLPDTAIRPYFCIVAQMLCSCLPNRIDTSSSFPNSLSLNAYWRGRGGRGYVRQVRHVSRQRLRHFRHHTRGGAIQDLRQLREDGDEECRRSDEAPLPPQS